MKRVVIVDDDERTRRILEILTKKMGLEAIVFDSPEPALDRLERESAALVLTDLKMPTMSGLELMRRLRSIDGEVPVVVLTAYGTVESAVEAMKLGALDFISKPFDIDALEVLIRRVLAHSRTERENRFLKEQADRGGGLEEMVGGSPAMASVFDLVRRVAPTKSVVLITGETGTGKELVARAIHRLSPRKSGLFVPLNCSAIPADLLESELFGHAKGAFSGAHEARSGKFETADGGTLFLDEIGDMDLRLQAKLLRVLQEGVVEPVGSSRRIDVDVRIVSSTNRDLESAIENGGFRPDLYYRLNVFRIHLPPLRDRSTDILPLASHFLYGFARDLGKGALALAPEAERLLEAHAWPGNVRELRNLMERAAVLADEREIGPELVAPSLAGAASTHSDSDLDLSRAVAETERRTILAALEAADGHKVQAAALLGIGERTLWSKLKKHGLTTSPPG